MIDAYGTWTSTGATDHLVETADALQYELGEGPCLSAWATESLQRINDTTDDDRWPGGQRLLLSRGSARCSASRCSSETGAWAR